MIPTIPMSNVFDYCESAEYAQQPYTPSSYYYSNPAFEPMNHASSPAYLSNNSDNNNNNNNGYYAEEEGQGGEVEAMDFEAESHTSSEESRPRGFYEDDSSFRLPLTATELDQEPGFEPNSADFAPLPAVGCMPFSSAVYRSCAPPLANTGDLSESWMNHGAVTVVGSFAPGGAYHTSFMPASALPSPTPIREATVASSPASWITPPQSVAQAGLTPDNSSVATQSPVPAGMNVYHHHGAMYHPQMMMMMPPSPASYPQQQQQRVPSVKRDAGSYNYHTRIGSTGSPLPMQQGGAGGAGLPDMFRVQATETSLRVSPYRPRSKSVIETKPHVLGEIRKVLAPQALKFVVLESTQRGQWLPGFPEVLGPDNAKLRYRFVFHVPHARYVDWGADFDLFSHNGQDFLEIENGEFTHPDVQFIKTSLDITVDMQTQNDSRDDFVVVEMNYQLKCKKDGPKKRAALLGQNRKLVYAPKFHFQAILRSEALGCEIKLDTPQFVHGSRKSNGVYDRTTAHDAMHFTGTERLGDEALVYQMLRSPAEWHAGCVYTLVSASGLPDSNVFIAVPVHMGGSPAYATGSGTPSSTASSSATASPPVYAAYATTVATPYGGAGGH